MQSTLLITGGSGYVGRATVRRALAEGHTVAATYHTHPGDIAGVRWLPLDLRVASEVDSLVAEVRPAAIIHAAAAWGTPETARAVILDGTHAVVRAAADAGVRLVHLSTDMVFDGEHAPYRESDVRNPISYYGRAKAEAEDIVAGALADYVIVRTSLVTCFDPPDPRTLEVVRALQATGTQLSDRSSVPGGIASPALTLFTDEYRCPIRTADLAAALVELATHAYRGILHVAGPERLSRYELGRRIASCLGLNGSMLCSGTSVASGMVRPRDCTLDTTLALSVLQTRLDGLP